MMVGAGLTLAGGFIVDYATRLYPDSLQVYTVLFGVGAAAGMVGVTFLARTPEPRMGIASHGRLHRLLAVREEGEVEEKVVLSELLNEVRRAGRSISNIAGMRHLTHFPYAELTVR